MELSFGSQTFKNFISTMKELLIKHTNLHPVVQVNLCSANHLFDHLTLQICIEYEQCALIKRFQLNLMVMFRTTRMLGFG